MQKFLLKFILLLIPVVLSAQGYLHQDGKNILDGNNENFIIRSIGTGNWMIQEGYMMQSNDAGLHTQHEFRDKLIETIGVERTDSFYTAWLQNHFTRTDVDSMKAWGFNAIRPALHYKWFTPPIEDEPVQGEITWLNRGFEMVDSLVKWCTDNEMYLILDMHGTPGGQGTNADISDYDPDKDALWENQDNKDKLIALWRRLAERYSDEPYVGGYDLINETNWTFTEANNKPLWDLFKDITAAIREVDTNHMIILEGNGFANDYNGLPTLWDDNMALSFHKYWTYNDEGSLNWMTTLRDQRNVPIWLGESGENSNTWFTSLIALAESKNIGWSWWPVKKGAINNVLEVTVNEDYTRLMQDWENTGPALSEDEIFQAVLTFAENHKIENCSVKYDVIDAMIRQPFTTETKPFKNHSIGQTIFAVDYDLGRNNFAYYDTDTANYNVSTDVYVNWNAGWSYRNDGVDIEACTDTETNGYNVGWSANGEWMQYTIHADTTAAYTVNIRFASGGSGANVRLEIDGVPASEKIVFTGTGGWQNWQTKQIDGIIFPAGSHKLKFVFETGGINLNYVKFTNPVPAESVEFKALDAYTTSGSKVILSLNKEITSDAGNLQISDFEILSNDTPLSITGLSINSENSRVIEIEIEDPIYYGDIATLSYSGTSIHNNAQVLSAISNLAIRNKLPVRYTIPGKIQAENFWFNNGFQLEACTDAGGGQNTGYSNAGDYLDYLISVSETDKYWIHYRVATTASNARLIAQANFSGSFVSLDTILFTSTGGWQEWNTQSGIIDLEEGKYTFRLKVLQGEHNLNWFEIVQYSASENHEVNDFRVFPNPAKNYVSIEIPSLDKADYNCTIIDITGKQILTQEFGSSVSLKLNIENLSNGIYFIKLSTGNSVLSTKKFVKN